MLFRKVLFKVFVYLIVLMISNVKVDFFSKMFILFKTYKTYENISLISFI